MSRVLATSPPTFTLLFLPNRTPAELTMKTWPLALTAPSITLRSRPITRLSTTDERPGWSKRTVSPAPTEKSCQSMTALFVAWLMTVVLPSRRTVATPLVTWPPVGAAKASAGTASATASATASVTVTPA